MKKKIDQAISTRAALERLGRMRSSKVFWTSIFPAFLFTDQAADERRSWSWRAPGQGILTDSDPGSVTQAKVAEGKVPRTLPVGRE
jgi:hypothetical protein